MNYLFLDVATNCGWAAWGSGMAAPIYGTWKLPGDPGEVGRKCIELHRHMAELHQMLPFQRINFEAAVPSPGMGGRTNMNTTSLLLGLVSHVESFAYVISARCRMVPQGSWRAHFIGQGRRLKSQTYKEFKALSTKACHDIGWRPADNNAADALGGLSYTIHLAGEDVPWRDAATFGARMAS